MIPLTENSPLVSALVSTYNSEEFIEGCLKDLLSQSISDRLEIVVIDSGSRQREGDMVREFQSRYPNIIYVRTEQRETVYSAWNRGIRVSRGKYLTNANTDDRHHRDALRIMAETLEGMPDIALVYADVALTYDKTDSFEGLNDKPHLLLKWDDWDRVLLLQKCFMGPQPMWRRQVHDVYGYFDPQLISSGDYEFWLRISQTFDFYHIPQVLGLYLSRPESVEKSNSKRDAEDAEIISLYIKAALSGRIIRCPALRDALRLFKRDRIEAGSVPFGFGKAIEGEVFEKIAPSSASKHLHRVLLESSSWWRRFIGSAQIL